MKSHRVTVKFPRSCKEKDVECKKRFYVSRDYGEVRINGEEYEDYTLWDFQEYIKLSSFARGIA